MGTSFRILPDSGNRSSFIGGSDARIIMGKDRDQLVRLWREKRGEALPLDLSNDLIVQLGSITEHLNRRLYERESGHTVQGVQRTVRHPIHKWMRADVGGRVRDTGAVFHASFLPSGHFSEPVLADLHMALLQHSMWVMAARSALLSIITGDGKRIQMTVPADPLYQHLLLTAEKKFLRCVQTGEPPALFGIEAPRPRPNSIKIIDMSASGQWSKFPASHFRSRDAPGELENSQQPRR
ncbi:YqaJ viral recombinase family protein [Bradyrhizobium manausense]|uniref:YqaJ viral recombinase family protein n=1 Tax=Bradyrhizobium manausense TaxID=989370 RepID=UPI001BA61B4C|nr:YqaJ viral recombinase family protein [Bradyrhizobium manausense]MBR1092699.1 YqaJ viral recombinase family protein [Bradyrhizobium manausense]